MFRKIFQKLVSDSNNLMFERTFLAIPASFVVGLVAALINGLDFLTAARNAFFFSLITGIIVLFLAWGVDTARQKGYPGLLGFLAVFILNVFGVLLLILLPARN